MGLIKALTTSVSSGLGDQFKEYVSCPEMDSDTLVQRGIVHHGEGNTNPSENIISNGSAIMVPESTAMMVVENGKILEFCAEAGTYTFNSGTEPSIFTGKLGTSIIDTVKNMWSRTTLGGQTGNDQRVYYVNLLSIVGNNFGSPQPKKITDDKYGMLEVTFFGEYAIKVENPVILVQNIIGSNAKDTVLFSDILEGQFKTKFVEKITQAITVVMRKHKVPFGDIGMYGTDISNEMNNLLDEDLFQKYGIRISDVAIGDINLTEESMLRVSKIDDATIFGDARLQSGLMATAGAEALKNAASNEGGAMIGIAGMNMMNNAGANMMGAVNQNFTPEQPKEEPAMPEPGTIFGSPQPTLTQEEVKPVEEITPNVSNGTIPNFCPNCGTKTSGGNFCGNCGTKLN